MESPNYRAVLIGIDDYSRKPLDGCVNDIDQIESILLDRLKVPPERITRLVAPRAGAHASIRLPSFLPTREGIWSTLTQLADEVSQQDLVFIYYSGHGSQREVRPVAREALVPVDFDGTAERLLWDFQLNPLLARVAERAGDLTIVLDCCHSASAVREDIGPQAKSRFLPLGDVRGLDTLIPDRALARELIGLSLPDDSYLLAAACHAGELAYEVPPGEIKPSQGSFTRALVQILEGIKQPLTDLCWSDVWNPLVDRVTGFSFRQNPFLVGRSERRIFGGAWTRRDPGCAIRSDGDHFRIAAGTLTGLSPEAEVAVYGPEPSLFPDLGSTEDQEARIGLLRVETAERSSCVATSANGMLNLPTGARGRLVKPGKLDLLPLALSPFDEALTDLLENSGFHVIRPNEQGSEPTVFVRRDRYGLFHLGDEIFSEGQDPERPPLVSLPANRPDLLVRALEHYARYNRALRLPRHPQNDKELVGTLQVELLDCRTLQTSGNGSLQDPDLPQLAFDDVWRYQVREGEGFAIRISNRISDPNAPPLNVVILNCAGSGRVEYLADGEIVAGAHQVFWRSSVQGSPFFPALATDDDRSEIVDRIVAVATTLPNQDLKYLEVRESFAETLQSYRSEDKDPDSRDTLGDAQRTARKAPQLPVEKWTAEMVTLRIYK
jgi:hypothetical protein